MKDRVKLSELSNKEMLLVGDNVTDKEDFIKDFEYFKDVTHDIENNVYTTTTYTAYIDAKQMLEDAIEREADNMHESWDQDMLNEITEQDIEDIQIIIDRILRRNGNYNICSPVPTGLSATKVSPSIKNNDPLICSLVILFSMLFIFFSTLSISNSTCLSD